MLKKYVLFSLAFIFLSSCSIDMLEAKCMVYSHGFGEDASNNASVFFNVFGAKISLPQYPDAPGQLRKAVFYTKPAVHVLANHLLEESKENSSIYLVGRSCGAGTAFNCLAKLIDFENNKEYFEGSNIKTKEDAERIINAVNNGAFVASAPFLSLRKAQSVTIPSAILSGTTYAVATGLAGCVMPTIMPAIIVGGASYILTGGYLKKGYASAMVKYGAPKLTNGHFDPSHPTPLASIAQLRGKLTCPILLHFNKEDGVLENPDADTVKVYDALKGEKTHIVISNDASHNSYSRQLRDQLFNFKMKYIDGKNINMPYSQPTVERLEDWIIGII